MNKKDLIFELNALLRSDKDTEDDLPPLLRLSELRYAIYSLIDKLNNSR